MQDGVRHDIDCDRMVLRSTALPPRHPASLETPAVLLARHDAEHDLAEALDGLGPGFAIGAGDAGALRLGQVALQLAAFRRQRQQALAPVALALALLDEALADELAEHDRKSVVSGKSVSVSVDLGGRGIVKKNKTERKK